MKRQFPFGGAKRYFPATITRVVEPPAARAEGTPEPDPNVTYRITGSSEFIVERGWFGMIWRERLLHGKANVQMGRFQSGNAPLLVDHETGDMVGVLDDAALRNGVTDCVARFSRSQRALEVRQDVDDKIRSSSSIGYIPKKARLVEEDPVAGDLWDVTLWEPIELSLVPCPADPTVGVQRSMRDGSGGGFPLVEVEEEERSMKKFVFDQATRTIIEVAADDPRPQATLEQIRAAGNPAPAPPAVTPPAPEVRNIHEEQATIAQMARDYGVPVEPEWIRSGLTPDQIGRKMAEVLATRGKGQPGAEALRAAGKDAEKYSIHRAIRQQLRFKETGQLPDGLEGDISREISRKLPVGYSGRGGIFVPMGAQARVQRALDSVTGGAGAELVSEVRGPFIEQLRAASILPRLGARVLTGITAPIAFAKKTGAATVRWRAENPGSPAPASDLQLGLVIANPKTMCGNTSYSRQLAMLLSEDVGTMIDTDLADGHGLALDLAGFHGIGQSEPLGVYNAPDVQIKAMGGVPTYAKLVDMLGLVADKNASRGSLGWATTALMAAKLRQTPDSASAVSRWIWDGTLENGNVVGYQAIYSTQLSKVLGAGAEHALIFGNWNDMIIALWDAMELLVDPYTLADEAMVRVLSFQMADIVIRHGESFCKATGATLT